MYFLFNLKGGAFMITYKKDSKDNLQSSDSSMPVLAMCYDFDKTLTPDDMHHTSRRWRNRKPWSQVRRFPGISRFHGPAQGT